MLGTEVLVFEVLGSESVNCMKECQTSDSMTVST